MTTFVTKTIPETAHPRLLKKGRRAILLLSVPLLIAVTAFPLNCVAAAELAMLDPLAATRIGRIEQFVTADAFRVDNKIGGRTLSAVGLDFTRHFIGGVEKDVPAIALGRWTLNYTMSDKSLIEALGGEVQPVSYA